MDLQTFLAWFSGMEENIKKQPTPAQWARILHKVNELKTAPASPTPVSTSVPVAPRKTKPTTASGWKAQYEAALVAMGFDEESAKEFLASVNVDLTRDPAEAAKADAGPMMSTH